MITSIENDPYYILYVELILLGVLNKKTKLITWIFWLMSCRRTAIVGPILSAAINQQRLRTAIGEAKKPKQYSEQDSEEHNSLKY